MTKNSNHGPYAVAAAIIVVGLFALDVPLGSWAILGLTLACPLMMIFMMRGMSSGMQHQSQPRADESVRPDEHRRS